MSNDIQNNRNPRNKRLFAGLILITIGSVYLLRQLDILLLPNWLFTWPIILIVVGLFKGIKHNFRHPSAFILIFIGIVFLLNQVFNFHLAYLFWPVILIALGLRLMLFKESRWCRERWEMRRAWQQKMYHHCHNAG